MTRREVVAMAGCFALVALPTVALIWPHLFLYPVLQFIHGGCA